MKEHYMPEFAGKRIWMYWPDVRACQFKENVEKGFMACGLPDDREVGDLNEIMNIRGGLDAALDEAYGKGRTAGGKKLLVEFANVMREGDFVIARSDFDYIVGIGIVTGDYYYDASRTKFRHCRKVDWIDTQSWPFVDELKCNGKWHRVTLIEHPFRKIAEQVITWICEGEDDENVADMVVEDAQQDDGQGDLRPSDFHSHSAFMNAARSYQESLVREWAKQFGNACIWDERPHHAVWLKNEYALKGLVFYEGFRQEIMDLYHSGKTKIGMNLLNNALRSEHIPYNLFFPMMKSEYREATKAFFNELLGTDTIADVEAVKIEYAPQPKYLYLNDGTSFDAFLLYRHIDGSKGAVGIEVKYTEREYKIGEMEYVNTHDGAGHVRLSNPYQWATSGSGYYLPDSEEQLVSDNLRQIWRNHILGASMVLRHDVNHFSSVTVFPNANPHFHIVSEDYRQLLTEKGKSTFFTFTYEKLFELLSHHFRSPEHQDWIKYLYHRYLFGTEEHKG